MIQNPATFDLVNLDHDTVSSIIESLVKNDRLMDAYEIYVKAYNVSYDIAYTAIFEINEYYKEE